MSLEYGTQRATEKSQSYAEELKKIRLNSKIITDPDPD
jgi:hypothetical protein